MTTLALIALALGLNQAPKAPASTFDSPAWSCQSRPLEQGTGNVRVCVKVQP